MCANSHNITKNCLNQQIFHVHEFVMWLGKCSYVAFHRILLKRVRDELILVYGKRVGVLLQSMVLWREYPRFPPTSLRSESFKANLSKSLALFLCLRLPSESKNVLIYLIISLGNLTLVNESGPAGDWKECRIFFLKCHVVELWRVSRISRKNIWIFSVIFFSPPLSLSVGYRPLFLVGKNALSPPGGAQVS